MAVELPCEVWATSQGPYQLTAPVVTCAMPAQGQASQHIHVLLCFIR